MSLMILVNPNKMHERLIAFAHSIHTQHYLSLNSIYERVLIPIGERLLCGKVNWIIWSWCGIMYAWVPGEYCGYRLCSTYMFIGQLPMFSTRYRMINRGASVTWTPTGTNKEGQKPARTKKKIVFDSPIVSNDHTKFRTNGDRELKWQERSLLDSKIV